MNWQKLMEFREQNDLPASDILQTFNHKRKTKIIRIWFNSKKRNLWVHYLEEESVKECNMSQEKEEEVV